MRVLYLGNSSLDDYLGTELESECFNLPSSVKGNLDVSGEVVDYEPASVCVQLVSIDGNNVDITHFRVIHKHLIPSTIATILNEFQQGSFYLVGGCDLSSASLDLLNSLKDELNKNGVEFDDSQTGGNCMRNTKVTKYGMKILERSFIGGSTKDIFLPFEC